MDNHSEFKDLTLISKNLSVSLKVLKESKRTLIECLDVRGFFEFFDIEMEDSSLSLIRGIAYEGNKSIFEIYDPFGKVSSFSFSPLQTEHLLSHIW
jgi:hypothetical protein